MGTTQSSVEIVSYTVHTGRLGSLGAEQLIALRHRRRGPDGYQLVGSSEITFADRFEHGGGFGIIAGVEGTGVQAFLPAEQYPVWIDLLRHEDPMYLHWSSERPTEYDPDGIVHLSTGPERPGEGPIDLSP